MEIRVNDGLGMIAVGDFFICYGERTMKVITDKGTMSVSPMTDNSIVIHSFINKDGNDDNKDNNNA